MVGYGGPVEHRMRFPLEVVDAVRAAGSAHVPMPARIPVVAWAAGGISSYADMNRGLAAGRAAPCLMARARLGILNGPGTRRTRWGTAWSGHRSMGRWSVATRAPLAGQDDRADRRRGSQRMIPGPASDSGPGAASVTSTCGPSGASCRPMLTRPAAGEPRRPTPTCRPSGSRAGRRPRAPRPSDRVEDDLEPRFERCERRP